jgi:TolA-binding protein
VQAADAVEAQLREDAIGLHAKGQSDKSKAELGSAARLYAVYLGRFGRSKAAYDMYFNAGELDFYHLENAQGAADNYLAAVRLNPKHKLSRDALHNALTALEVTRAQEFDTAKASGKPLRESPTDKKLTEAMELYIASYPDDKAVPELLFRQGKLYYDYAVYDPAVRQFGLLLEKYPSSTQARTAGELILDSFNKSQDYENIEVWARRLKKAPAFAGATEQKKLDVLIVGAVFKQGEQLASAGEHGRAAQAYLRAAKEFPGEPRAAQAAVNAEVEAKRAADLDTLSVAANLLSTKFGNREEVAQGLWIAATTYQEIGLFADAAGYHEQIAERFPKSEHHKDAAYDAVLLRTTVRDHERAIKDGEAFKKSYPRDPLAAEATFLMGKAHEAAEKWKDAERLYLSYATSAPNPSRRIEAWVRLALVRKDDPRGRERALDEAMKVHGAYKQRLDDKGKYFAAQARYLAGTRYVAEFDTVTIEGDVKQLSSRLKKKSQLLKKAAEEFIEASKMGVAEWTTASLYQIGHTYESFSRSLLDSPPPQGLSQDDAELYRQSIDEFVVPIEERSIEAYESGWAKAVELGIFNEWTAKMRTALGRLSSEAYPPLEEVGFSVRSKGPLPLPPLVVGLRRKPDGTSAPYAMPLSKVEATDDKANKPSATAKPGRTP